jgi:hypothetical protein
MLIERSSNSGRGQMRQAGGPSPSGIHKWHESAPLDSTERKKNVSPVKYNYDLLEGSRCIKRS